MSIPYPDWKTVVIDNDEDQNKTLKQAFNDALTKLIKNDDRFDFDSDLIPDIWRCRWYNQPQYDDLSVDFGYPKGYAVWLNTEDLDEFVTYRYDEISATVKKNSSLASRLKSVEGDLPRTMQLFKSLVFNADTPRKVSGGPYGEPLYCIGDLSGRT